MAYKGITTTGVIGITGVTGTTGTTGYSGMSGYTTSTTSSATSWVATYTTSSGAWFTPSGIVSNYYIPPVEIKFGFTLQFKTSKAKLIKLLNGDEPSFEPTELKKIL